MRFYRQRIFIEFLRQANRPVGKIELMKWAFLLKAESPSRGGASFYEFVPYKFGPYSFGLARDAHDLQRDGWLLETDKHWERIPISAPPGIPREIERDVQRIVQRFQNATLDDLLDRVYRSHVAYTVMSTRRRLADRPVAPPAIYTIGYEGRQLDGLLDALVQAGIRRLVDVRRNPISRRFGFHKGTLERHCRLLEIDYIHLPELGIASEERSHLSANREYSELFAKYECTTLDEQASSVRKLSAWMAETATAAMCMERDPCDCHRGRLAKRIHELSSLPIIHLR